MNSLIKSVVIIVTLNSIVFAMPTAKEKFIKADVNNDRFLTSEEFYDNQAKKMEQKIREGKALKGAATAPQFENVDTNKDGKVTFKEFDIFHEKRQKEMAIIKRQSGMNKKGLEIFNSFDENGNGCIDKSEFKNLYKSLGKKRGGN